MNGPVADTGSPESGAQLPTPIVEDLCSAAFETNIEVSTSSTLLLAVGIILRGRFYCLSNIQNIQNIQNIEISNLESYLQFYNFLIFGFLSTHFVSSSKWFEYFSTS